MRINIYGEELTDDTQAVFKPVTNDRIGEVTFVGVRTFLESPDTLHYGPDDDDRSAVTFWAPWTKANGHDFGAVRRVLMCMLDDLNTAEGMVTD